MGLFSLYEINFGKLTFISGSIAWVSNLMYYMLNLKHIKHAQIICFIFSITFMLSSMMLSIISIRNSQKSKIVLCFLYWSAILLLTLPVVLEISGILPTLDSHNSFYYFMLISINAHLFGINAFIPCIVLPFIIVFYSAVHLSMLTWSLCNMRP